MVWHGWWLVHGNYFRFAGAFSRKCTETNGHWDGALIARMLAHTHYYVCSFRSYGLTNHTTGLNGRRSSGIGLEVWACAALKRPEHALVLWMGVYHICMWLFLGRTANHKIHIQSNVRIICAIVICFLYDIFLELWEYYNKWETGRFVLVFLMWVYLLNPIRY